MPLYDTYHMHAISNKMSILRKKDLRNSLKRKKGRSIDVEVSIKEDFIILWTVSSILLLVEKILRGNVLNGNKEHHDNICYLLFAIYLYFTLISHPLQFVLENWNQRRSKGKARRLLSRVLPKIYEKSHVKGF